MPTICDRIVQEAIRMVLEPIYEADFSQYSFGFRPNRRTMDAIKCITWSIQERKKYFWIIEGDIASYFDTIHQGKLVQILRKRIKDERLLKLIWKFLRAGVMEGKLFRDTKHGTPQGGIGTPLTQRKRLVDGQDMADGNFLRTDVHDDFLNQETHKVFAFRK